MSEERAYPNLQVGSGFWAQDVAFRGCDRARWDCCSMSSPWSRSARGMRAARGPARAPGPLPLTVLSSVKRCGGGLFWAAVRVGGESRADVCRPACPLSPRRPLTPRVRFRICRPWAGLVTSGLDRRPQVGPTRGVVQVGRPPEQQGPPQCASLGDPVSHANRPAEGPCSDPRRHPSPGAGPEGSPLICPDPSRFPSAPSQCFPNTP